MALVEALPSCSPPVSPAHAQDVNIPENLSFHRLPCDPSDRAGCVRGRTANETAPSFRQPVVWWERGRCIHSLMQYSRWWSKVVQGRAVRNHRGGGIRVGPWRKCGCWMERSLAGKENSQCNEAGDGEGRAPGTGTWLGARGV